MMTDKTIEEQIREYYLAGNGEWLVEKGKVKEAKLLKQAVERIDGLKNNLKYFSNRCTELENSINEKISARRKELDDREEKLLRRENVLTQKIANAKKALSYLD
jgi:hypothetical protein